jgi:bifunctional DNA-binding transcriptional regulator/antitoxin component of YhaV-PrlF toxin-antitoxin module
MAGPSGRKKPSRGKPRLRTSRESSVYERGQTVIPKQIREAAAIEYGARLRWEIEEGVIRVTPLPKNPLRASIGILKGTGYTLEEFLRERNEERAREREREAEEEARWRSSSTRRQS